jgi:zinc/manganese transport system substrate-binding protein
MKEKIMGTKLKSAVLGALLASSSLAASSGIASAHDKIKVVSSFSILSDFVQRVGGDHVDLVTIVGVDGDAHVYEPKPDDAKAMAAAQLVVVNGLGFEGWLDRLVDSSGYKGPIVKASDGIEPEKMDEGHGDAHAEGAKKATHDHDHDHAEGKKKAEHDHEHDHGHDHGEFDPHAWQSAANAQVYVKNIADALCGIEKSKCSEFKANAEGYSQELATLHGSIKKAIDALPEGRRTVITSHDAFGYFSHAYGVEFLAPEGVSTESEASAMDVARLIEQIREDKASALFVENISDPRLIEQISRETGLKIGGALYSDALSAKDGPAPSYIEMMQYNTRLLTEAMTGS